jgi:hypothetical protein
MARTVAGSPSSDRAVTIGENDLNDSIAIEATHLGSDPEASFFISEAAGPF